MPICGRSPTMPTLRALIPASQRYRLRRCRNEARFGARRGCCDQSSLMRHAVMGVAAVGVALLVWTASPIWWNGLAVRGTGQVPEVAFLAVLFGTPAGSWQGCSAAVE